MSSFVGNSLVSLNENRHDTSGSFNTERKRSNIDQKDIFDFRSSGIGKNGALNSSSVSNGFVWVDGLVGLFAIEEVSEEFNNLGNSGGSTDE